MNKEDRQMKIVITLSLSEIRNCLKYGNLPIPIEQELRLAERRLTKLMSPIPIKKNLEESKKFEEANK